MPKEDFKNVFLNLKKILTKHEKNINLKLNNPENYVLDTDFVEKFKKEICFGSVHIKKNYVSYYLLPVYVYPDLLKNISPELKKRMQGKSCFNFKSVDPKIFKELENLTKLGFKKFKESGIV